jgi:divalent metal cation (Fe/Co/Zn/Cd) transporter
VNIKRLGQELLFYRSLRVVWVLTDVLIVGVAYISQFGLHVYYAANLAVMKRCEYNQVYANNWRHLVDASFSKIGLVFGYLIETLYHIAILKSLGLKLTFLNYVHTCGFKI